MPEGFSDGELATKTGHCQRQQEPGVGHGHTHPAGRSQHTGPHRHQQHHRKHHAFAAVGAAEQAAADGSHGVTERGTQSRQATDRDQAGGQGLSIRAQCDQHTDKADADGPPVRAWHPLTQHRHRQHRDQQRRHKEQGVAGRQRQVAHRQGEQRQHHDAKRTPQQVQRPADAQQAGPGPSPRDVEQYQGQCGHAAQGRDLQHRVAGGQGFEHRVHEGKAANGQQHGDDAAQVAAAVVVGMGRHGIMCGSGPKPASVAQITPVCRAARRR